jgi:ribonuclease HII
LAKVHRDRLCDAMHQLYPLYGFDQHKGYGTAQHLAALQAHGPADCHRMTFAPVARSVR